MCRQLNEYQYLFIFFYSSCPAVCSCVGLSVDCTSVTDTDNINTNDTILSPNTKLLDFSTNLLHAFKLNNQALNYLIHLNISGCGISKLFTIFFKPMRNLKILDIGHNKLQTLQSFLFQNLSYLENVHIAGNLDMLSIESEAFVGLTSVSSIILSNLHLGYIHENAFSFLEIKLLDLSDATIHSVESNAFANLRTERLYLNGSDIQSFSHDMFQGIAILDALVSDKYIFCCIKPSTIPEENCYPHKGDFSSCSDLIDSDSLRPLVWISGLLAILANIFSLFYRVLFDRKSFSIAYGIFVSNLAVSDFLMGVYLLIIACADASYRETYIFNDELWRSSIWCSLAGFLSFWSSEVSVLFLCLICADRILVIKYPFGQIRITLIKSYLFACVVWVIAAIIAVSPIIYETYSGDLFYSKASICLALPLTNNRPTGWVYPVYLFTIMNTSVLCLVAFAHWSISKEEHILKTRLAGKWTVRSNDLNITRNILWMVTTNFLCWVPVGFVGKVVRRSELFAYRDTLTSHHTRPIIIIKKTRKQK